MTCLYLAIPRQQRVAKEAFLDERTAGAWRDHIDFIDVASGVENKDANNAQIETVASAAHVTIFAPRACTSASLQNAFPNVHRFATAELDRQLVRWLESTRLSWRANYEVCKKLGGYRWMDYKDWCEQFERVDKARGKRVAAGLLAQLRVATVGELGAWFDMSEEVDHNVYFLGSDPHSGDHGLVNTLSARITGNKLSEATKLPMLASASKVRVFNDGGWSGGESCLRLECLYTPCTKKSNALPKDAQVSMRFAYLTEAGEDRIRTTVADLRSNGVLSGKVDFSYPTANRLVVGSGDAKGLAFQNEHILRFVDAADLGAMKSICKKIGKQLDKNRALGTAGVASTIAFEHSLPKAMLPVFIFDDRKVKDEAGSEFTWRPLVNSKHVNAAVDDDQSAFYCDSCPFLREKKEKLPVVMQTVPAETSALLGLTTALHKN
jgi:hypothetical protein